MNEIVSIRLSFLKSVTFVTFWRYHNEFNHLDGNAKVTAAPAPLLLLPFGGLTDKNGRNVNKECVKMAHEKMFKKRCKII